MIFFFPIITHQVFYFFILLCILYIKFASSAFHWCIVSAHRYGDHPAFFRYRSNSGKLLPLFYVYDSYLQSPDIWAQLLKRTGKTSIRNTPYDGIFIGLLVEEKHKAEALAAGFDGIYTYFATNSFSYGSSQQNWRSIKAFCDNNKLIFIPSVGPGYIDTSIRPWNGQNTRNRINGKYYEMSLKAALETRPKIISVTSFNEWHEGTQIETAIPKTRGQTAYLDYLPYKPTLYLDITQRWAEKFREEQEKWLQWLILWISDFFMKCLSIYTEVSIFAKYLVTSLSQWIVHQMSWLKCHLKMYFLKYEKCIIYCMYFVVGSCESKERSFSDCSSISWIVQQIIHYFWLKFVIYIIAGINFWLGFNLVWFGSLGKPKKCCEIWILEILPVFLSITSVDISTKN